MTSLSGRSLHFVLKIANRKANYDFFTKVLGMKILRHEEFEKGCEAACNGPYDGKWSKTMVGYGPEDDHFVVELTYNYAVRDYKLGNDFAGFIISGKGLLQNVQETGYPKVEKDSSFSLLSPDGIKFSVAKDNTVFANTEAGPVKECCLHVSDLAVSLEYWRDFVQMTLVSKTETEAVLTYSDKQQCYLKLIKVEESINHASAYGRIAFSVPEDQVLQMETKSKEKGYKVLTPFVSLDTPGKATVRVVILADPDGHEICFVGDEGFRDLSQVQADADECIRRAIEADKSDQWIKKQAAMGIIR